MGKQTAKVKEVYCDKLKIKLTFEINLSMTLEDISLKRGALSHKPVIFAASVKTYCKYIWLQFIFGGVESRIYQ